MAEKENIKLVRKVSFIVMHKIVAALSLLTLLVVLIASLLAKASVFSMTWRALVAILIVKLASVVVIKLLATYEEMDGV
ncbi:MAG: hypothetical protein KDD56_06250 [Bdellovibrionales bacterium]|nr:hypothetical protein [Bdellovibrionales bacterium]